MVAQGYGMVKRVVQSVATSGLPTSIVLQPSWWNQVASDENGGDGHDLSTIVDESKGHPSRRHVF